MNVKLNANAKNVWLYDVCGYWVVSGFHTMAVVAQGVERVLWVRPALSLGNLNTLYVSDLVG